MARKPPVIRTVEVLRREQVSPHMLRITFGGSGLQTFPDDQDGAYIKLRMSEPAAGSDERPLVRTYTVRKFDADRREIEVDFVLHDSDGPAASWAARCAPGDTINIMGPGPRKLVNLDADWFLLAGDMSAMPAILANLELLPDTARGYLILEIMAAADQPCIDAPAGIDVQWIINPQPEVPNTLLLDAVRKVRWLEGTPSIWVAGEFSLAIDLRSYLRQEHGADRSNLYASSYWQMGMSEDEHRVSKRNAADD